MSRCSHSERLGNRLNVGGEGDRGVQMDPRFLAVELDRCWAHSLRQRLLKGTSLGGNGEFSFEC